MWGLTSPPQPAGRSACGTVAMSEPGTSESPLANVVTSWPRSVSSVASAWTMRSVPPYTAGGTRSSGGATRAIRRGRPPSSGLDRGAGSGCRSSMRLLPSDGFSGLAAHHQDTASASHAVWRRGRRTLHRAGSSPEGLMTARRGSRYPPASAHVPRGSALAPPSPMVAVARAMLRFASPSARRPSRPRAGGPGRSGYSLDLASRVTSSPRRTSSSASGRACR